jgi:hypothetical protein
MSNTQQTKRDIDFWNEEMPRSARYIKLKTLATEGGIEEEFLQVPQLHFKNMSYDQYMINIYAMAKIRELKRLADRKQGVGRVDW